VELCLPYEEMELDWPWVVVEL